MIEIKWHDAFLHIRVILKKNLLSIFFNYANFFTRNDVVFRLKGGGDDAAELFFSSQLL